MKGHEGKQWYSIDLKFEVTVPFDSLKGDYIFVILNRGKNVMKIGGYTVEDRTV